MATMSKRKISLLKFSIFISVPAFFVLWILPQFLPRLPQIFPMNSNTAGIWSAIATIIQAAIAVLLWQVTNEQANISAKQAEIAETALKETQKSTALATESVKISQASLVYAQRPWLKVQWDTDKGGAIRWHKSNDADIVHAYLGFEIKNVGNSPAINVRVHFNLEVSPYNQTSQEKTKWPHERQKIYADYIQTKIDPNYLNHTIFHGDEITIYKDGGCLDENYNSIDIPRHLKSINADPDKFGGFFVIGVVFYQFQRDGEFFRTPIVMQTQLHDSLKVGDNLEQGKYHVSDLFYGSAPTT